MKRARAVLSLILAGVAFWALDNRHGAFPALGKLLDPFAGFWQNGERADELPATLIVPGLRDEVQVVWDDRRVPHIFAKNDHDLFLAQGYVAASLRLWQMDFQSLYTAGRISEVIGPAGVRQDIFMRRFGLPWAAARALRAFHEDPRTRETLDAFTAGVNARIRDLGRRRLPVEFKILDYEPEPWTNEKCALLLKTIAFSLTSFNRDAAMTRLRDSGGAWAEDVERLFPLFPPLVEPVIPPGTPCDFAPVPVPSAPSGEAARSGPASGGASRGPGGDKTEDPAPWAGPKLGSNNWAVSGRLTRSGYPILCNDMHLELSLPAIWYEVQLTAPGINVRGVAFPPAPLVIAGYNESIAWGFTAGTDDVLDWYAITFKDGTRAEYLHGGEWKPTTVREETIRVRGGRTVVERVVSTHHGPIVRWDDESPLPGLDVPAGAALRWLGHEPSNELATVQAIDRAGSYDEFVAALGSWACPSQNVAYADRDGTVAIWHIGQFPLRWKGQGRFILDGSDPAHDWQGMVPHEQIPHVRDPERGFVSSANQAPADAAYPYYLGCEYGEFERGARINEVLRASRGLVPEDMVRLQADVLDIRARAVLLRLLEIVGNAAGTETERRCAEELRRWGLESRAESVAPTIFNEIWNELNRLTWDDEAGAAGETMPWPGSQVVVDLFLNAPDARWFDDRATPEVESGREIGGRAFRSAAAKLEKRLGPVSEAWRWGSVRGTQVAHLARIEAFGRTVPDADGAGQVVNAVDAVWGPSWRMVVELGPEIRAWGNYPGGQSGNPGSRSYDDRVDDWAAGKPYELVFLKSADGLDPRIAGRTTMRGAR